MLALFANSKSEPTADTLDIRTRILVSLICSTLAIFLDRASPIGMLSVLTFFYVLHTRRYSLIGISYVLILLMTILSLGVVYAFFGGLEWCMIQAECGAAKMIGGFKGQMLTSFYLPFMRMIPTINVLLALSLNFDVQRFMAAMKSWRLPRIIFLPLMVFCRFIPEFIHNVRQLREAVLLRGFSITFGSALIHPVQTLRLTLVPLVVRTLRISDNLAVAAEMKRVGYVKNPTRRHERQMGWRDIALLATALVVGVALIYWQHSLPELPKMGGHPS